MRPEDARRLADRISQHWGGRLTPSQLEYWAEELGPLEDGAAGTAFARLKASSHRPTLGEYLEVYRSLVVHDAGNPAPACSVCSGSGLVTDTNHPAHWPGDRSTVPVLPDGVCGCNVGTWCRQCAEGGKAREMLRRFDRGGSMRQAAA